MKLKNHICFICSQNASPEGFAVEVLETSVVVLTSATARPIESSSVSVLNYPYFTLDDVHNYGIIFDKTDWLGSLTSFKSSVQSCFVLC